MALLTQAEVEKLITTILNSDVDVDTQRRLFLLGINAGFRGTLTHINSPRAQLTADIGKMNQLERLADGQVPLLIYLINIANLIPGQTGEIELRKVADHLLRDTTGAPLPDVSDMPEMKEVIIFRDDMVTHEFMRAGLEAGRSVVKLLVPSYNNGQLRMIGDQPMIFLGTGWLISSSLLMTNHHVINARRENETDAPGNDLLKQAENTVALFDYDTDNSSGTEVAVLELLAWNKELDYAVLRIPAGDRPALKCVRQKLDVQNDSIAVNIIQHPNGKSKRYGIRNNLVSASAEKDLRYFTDTEIGSSGSPVLNDKWQVVALHKAALYAAEVNFQGKKTAYVNIGTHINLVIEDIQKNYPGLSVEITG